ncbi:MAG: fasciclin domain-containing protein [Cyanobacteria bacterium J06638_20]
MKWLCATGVLFAALPIASVASAPREVSPDRTPVAAYGVAQAEPTVVDVAASSDSFQTLTAALQAAGLEDTLRGDGPFTVFAPTDEAFSALPAGTVEALLQPENRDRLVQILTYHVVPGAVTSSDIHPGEAATVEGSSVDLMVQGSTVQVNDATVIQADVPASNGVIHVIDRVLIPE